MSGYPIQKWITGTGLLLVVLGIGFVTDRDHRFVNIGIVLCAVGLVCLLLPGWISFRKSRS
jgi:hypothetical protein